MSILKLNKNLPEFILFSLEEKSDGPLLKNALQYLKCKGKASPLRFSYVERKVDFLPNLTLARNIQLSLCHGPTHHGLSLEAYAKVKTDNPHIFKLITYIDQFMDKTPNAISRQDKKLAGLILGLLKEHPLVILENPEEYIQDNKLYEITKKAIEYKYQEENADVFITTGSPADWSGLVTKAVARKKDRSFENISLESVITDFKLPEAA